MNHPALFELDETPPPARTPEAAQAGYEATLEFCYRVTLEGPHVGSRGCGVTIWHDDEVGALREAESAAERYPGPKIATVERRVVRITGPRKDQRELVAFMPVRTIGWNPEVPSSETTERSTDS